MPSPTEHAKRIHETLLEVERLQRRLRRATRDHHGALQAALEEHGPALVGDITIFGGGTPKTPDPE